MSLQGHGAGPVQAAAFTLRACLRPHRLRLLAPAAIVLAISCQQRDAATGRGNRGVDAPSPAESLRGSRSERAASVSAGGGRSEAVPLGPESLRTSRYERLGLVDVLEVDSTLRVDLRYAGPDNFMGTPIYDDVDACYLRPEAARKLARAHEILKSRRPDLRLLLLDCLRPRSGQRRIWEKLENTPFRRYAADPTKGSMHNYGAAVDLTLSDRDGRPLDMGTPYDFFGPEAQPRHEDRLLREGRLDSSQVANRRLLREVMREAGFLPLDLEWWHFDAFEKRTVRRRWKMVE